MVQKEVRRLTNDEKDALRVCLSYLNKKVTWGIIKDETGFYDRKVDRTLKKLIDLGLLEKEGKYYKIDKDKTKKIREILEYNQREDNLLYSYIPQLIQVVLIGLIVVAVVYIVGVLFFHEPFAMTVQSYEEIEVYAYDSFDSCIEIKLKERGNRTIYKDPDCEIVIEDGKK